MRIPLSEVPRPVIERLKALQAQPSAFDCFYRPLGGRGVGIFGIVVAILSAFGLVAGALATELPLPVTILGGILCGGILWSSTSRIRRFGAAEVKPLSIVNPLCFARVTLDELTVHDLWAELKDLKIVHHHTNSVYTHTQFEFVFGKARETLIVAPKAKAEELADRIESYRRRLLAAVDGQADPGEVFGHDLFAELRLPGGQLKQVPPSASGAGRRAALAWGVGGGAGAVLGGALFLVSNVAAQDRSIQHCYGVDSCARYFDRYSYPLLTGRAQRKLTATYKKEWETNKTSIRALRKMKALERVPHVTPEQEKEILALYREGSEKELRALFQSAIQKYLTLSGGADPRARQAIQRLLELARDKGFYRTRVTYQGVTERVQGPIELPPAARGRTLVPMGPSFTPTLNRSREAMITERIQRAFIAILPQDLLEFEGLDRDRYGSSTSGRYGSYRSRYGSRYGARALPVAVAEGSATPSTPAELELQVSYVVFPSGSVYVSRNDASKLYMGIGFDWIVNIKVKQESIYLVKQQSFPPPRFSVSSYQSRYAPSAGLAAGTVYSTMAGTAFDDFSKNLVRHFGIGAVPSRPLSPTALPASIRSKLGIRPGVRSSY